VSVSIVGACGNFVGAIGGAMRVGQCEGRKQQFYNVETIGGMLINLKLRTYPTFSRREYTEE
jgi:hypothetical protein